MPTCAICMETLKSPVALPCGKLWLTSSLLIELTSRWVSSGHVYCQECITKIVQHAPATSMHQRSCPMCRHLFPIGTSFLSLPSPTLPHTSSRTTVAIDPHFVPPYLHPYLLPPFRKLYLDSTPDLPCPNPGSGPAKWQETREQLETERDRLRAENAVLRTSCAAWRRRADAHAAVHIGLATFARLARDYARMMHVQRDELAQRCESLKRKYDANDNDNGCVHFFFVSNFTMFILTLKIQ